MVRLWGKVNRKQHASFVSRVKPQNICAPAKIETLLWGNQSGFGPLERNIVSIKVEAVGLLLISLFAEFMDP
jgi:hypothetical protein